MLINKIKADSLDARKNKNAVTATVVVRPDSGDPPTIVQNCVGLLGEKFGLQPMLKATKCYIRACE